MNKPPASILVNFIPFFFIIIFSNENPISTNTWYKILYVSDLALDSKTFDVNEVINLDPSKIKVKETSERIVRKIQDWLLKEASSKEIAGLPEDTTQRLLVGVSFIYFSCLDIFSDNPFFF